MKSKFSTSFYLKKRTEDKKYVKT